MEKWKQLFNGLEISDLGRVKQNGKMCQLLYDKQGYAYIDTKLSIHQLVAENFIEGIVTEVVHIDGDILNNCVDNLKLIEGRMKYNVPTFINTDTNKTQKNYHLLKKIICTTTNEVFDSCKAACKYFNISNSSLSRCLKGHKDDIDGLNFEYYN